MSGNMFFRIVGLLGFGALGGWGAEAVAQTRDTFWVAAVAAVAAAIGFGIAPYLTSRPFNSIVRRLEKVNASVILSGTLGLFVGLTVSVMLALPLSMLPDAWGRLLPITVTVLLGYLGISVMVTHEKELALLLGGFRHDRGAKPEVCGGNVLVDTSAIIDGRIADISQSGFIQGNLLIPKFILDELQHISDSADAMRRNRGRRGLEILAKLQKESEAPVQIIEADSPAVQGVHTVDSKLVEMAKSLNCPIVTNDFNLNKVAGLQGVKVLNINELANAVKSVVLPGEEMTVRVIQEGREAGQGVGFLEDGTMVVVEGARRYINTELDIVVTRVLQTAAGRMIFAHLRNGAKDEAAKR